MAANCSTARWLRPIFVLLALTGLALLGGCGGGSGAPNNPFAPPPTTPGKPVILPATSVVYSNTPATLTVDGGVPPYLIVSSNTAILPVAQAVTTGTIVLLPANVLSNTAVVISAQDSIGQTASATVTVSPAPIFNTLSVKPNSAACGTNAICSGQTATASVTVMGPGGVGEPNRQVRFDVVTGAFSIESSDPANPLVSTLTVVSDVNGVAQVILKADPSAFTQPALLRATDVTTGEQQTAQFTIVQTINGSAVLSVVPSTATITGPDSATCSTGFRIDYYIYGGTAPYTVVSTFPTAVTIVNSTVLAPGLPFTAITNGSCVNPLTFSIRDANGLQTTATLINQPGSGAPAAPPPAGLSVVTQFPTGWDCTKQFTVLITGGTAPYNISANVAGVGYIPGPTPSAPGFVIVDPSGAGLVSGDKVTFLVADSSTPQQTDSFSKTCP
jgi:hypothetical protein